MFELLHLPPVAQAVLTITGIVLAVVRLLTASKAFWWRFPAWLQKGLPAALVALGTLPQALELAKSWLDIVTALVVAVGVWFTASRGDQKPVEASKPKVPTLPVLYLFALAAFVSVQPWLAGCSAFSSVTPADRAEAYAAQARAAELACRAYVFDRSSGLVGDVPTMAKLCAGE